MAGSDQAAKQSSEVLHQRRNVGRCPVRMAMGGVAIAATLGYLVLYSKKKPEATALDVAKAATGVSHRRN